MNSQREHYFHLWAPDIFRIKGGIQTYSAFLLEALGSLEHQVRCRVVLKNDVGFPLEYHKQPITQYAFTGSAPEKIRNGYFALQTIGSGFLSRPELVISTHAHFAVLARYLKRTAGIPYWIVAHGVEVWELKNQSLLPALQEADLIVSVSEYTRDRLLAEHPLDRDRIVVLPNTMDAERFNISPKPKHLMERHGIRPDQPVILTVGRLEKGEQYKGYDTILKAMPAIKQSFPGVRYLIVGTGDDRPRIERMIADFNLGDCATLTGFIPDEELRDYYNLCDVFAMPSKGEGFGIVYLEAMACGKPVLAGNKDGSVDALRQGELGVLVDPDNVEQIASAIIGVFNKTFPHPLIYDAHLLRRKVIDAYGYESFRRKLAALVNQKLSLNS